MGFRDDFSYAYFRRLLAALQAHYPLYCFHEAPPRLKDEQRRLLLLRHDVDVSLERAVDMARIEHESGVRATYMVLSKAALYDFQAPAEAKLMRELRRCGHEVGLHFDIEAEGVLPDASLAELEDALARARDRLAETLEEPVLSCAFHRPITRLLRGPLTIADMVNAYAAELMEGYISDSKANWREGDPLARLLRQPQPAVFQVLIHPIWWGAEHQSGPERLQRFFEQQTLGKPADEAAAYSDALSRAVPAVQREGLAPAR